MDIKYENKYGPKYLSSCKGKISEAKLQMGDQGDNRDFNVSETPLTSSL
jgi:hypothetical protein